MKNWVPVDRDQALLLPPSVDELLPPNHLARFVVEVVDRLDISAILSKYGDRGRGSTPYHPAMMLALLFYGYTTGVMSSRRIERACRFDLAFRFIAAGAAPDHDTVANFRRNNLAEIAALFHEILRIAREMGYLKVGSVAVDGTKMKANASRHSAVSYAKAREMEARLKSEVDRLLKMAEGADKTSPSPRGSTSLRRSRGARSALRSSPPLRRGGGRRRARDGFARAGAPAGGHEVRVVDSRGGVRVDPVRRADGALERRRPGGAAGMGRGRGCGRRGRRAAGEPTREHLLMRVLG